MKKKFLLVGLLVLVMSFGVTGCSDDGEISSENEETGTVVVEEPAVVTEPEDVEEFDIIEEPEAQEAPEIGSGSGTSEDPYIVEIGEVYSGNLPEYGMVSSVVYYRVLAEPGQNYTGTLTITATNRSEEPFWAKMIASDGPYVDDYIEEDQVTNVLDLLGQELIKVSAATDETYLDFVLQTNVTSDDVIYEFVVTEE